MTSWQVVLVFVGIPAALICVISLTVSLLSSARVPDGKAAAQRPLERPEAQVDATAEERPGTVKEGACQRRLKIDPLATGEY